MSLNRNSGDHLSLISAEEVISSKQEKKSLLKSEEILLTLPTADTIHEGQISLTHGFIPYQRLMEFLPEKYREWDNISAKLPSYLELGCEREEIAKLPLLIANDSTSLPDQYLARAASILGNLAHAYYFNQRKGTDQNSDPLPANIRTPWEQVTKRLGRKLPHYSEEKLAAARNHYDTFLCNVKVSNPMLMDGERNVEIGMDDLNLLVPAFSNNEEHVFNLTIALMEIRFAPALKQIIKVVKAVAEKNDADLIVALKKLTSVIEAVTAALDYLTPNEHSKYYVDPSIWTKTVAKFDGQIPGGLPGLSASLMPLFHTLDSVMEREVHDSTLGQAIVEKFHVQPDRVANFISALRSDLVQYSLRAYVQQSKNVLLKNQYQSFVDAYLGKYGLTNIHANKAYGYMKINFRNGRLETNGGHRGGATVESEPQRQVYKDFNDADSERLKSFIPWPHYATQVKVNMFGDNASEVILDMTQTGLDFLPGDRCAILPKNSKTEIETLVNEYKIDIDQEIKLNPAWKKFYFQAFGLQRDAVKVEELLEYLDINHFKQLNMKYFDITAVRPLTARFYSVSPTEKSAQIRLTVGRHFYTQQSLTHEGIGSSYVVKSRSVHIEKAPARSFHLPKNPETPILMFAAGTGISPFMGFINARNKSTGLNWLFLSTQTKSTFYYKEELQEAVKNNSLSLSLIFSREQNENSIQFNAKTNSFDYVKKYDGKHIDELIKENANSIAELIANGAHIYVCGSAGFAKTVRNSIEVALLDSKVTETSKKTETYIDNLIADHCYHSDVFTSANNEKKDFDLTRSQVAYHNKINDCWVIINGSIYDLSKFINVHPGGRKIVHVNAGLDASADYNAIKHNQDPQVEALLAEYKIGKLVIPNFTNKKVENLYKKCIVLLEALLEMENTLSNNTTFLSKDAAPFLWREVYSVLIEGRIASYSDLGNVGSFKYVFGTLLKDMSETAQFPKDQIDDLQELFNTLLKVATETGGLIRNKGAVFSSEVELKKLNLTFTRLLDETLKFIGAVKADTIAIAERLEKSGDEFEMEYVADRLKNITSNMNTYLRRVKDIHSSLNSNTSTSMLGFFAVANTCPFEHTPVKPVCPIGLGLADSKSSISSAKPPITTHRATL